MGAASSIEASWRIGYNAGIQIQAGSRERLA